MPIHKMKKVMPNFILPKELLEIIFSFSNKEDSLNFLKLVIYLAPLFGIHLIPFITDLKKKPTKYLNKIQR
jgi:hypothetical protein